MPPVPCGASRETVKRLELAGWAGYGYCAARTRWYWGLKLYLVTAPDGMPAAWCPASPKPGEREVGPRPAGSCRPQRRAAARLHPIGDKGFAWRDFEHLVTAGSGLYLVRPDRRDETPRHGSIDWIRQWIESVNDTLKGQLDLERHGGRTPGSVRPDHPAAAGHGRLHLAQLGSRRTRQTLAGCLRQLNS